MFDIKEKLEDKYLKDINKEDNEKEDNNSIIGEMANNIKKDKFTLKQKIVINFFMFNCWIGTRCYIF